MQTRVSSKRVAAAERSEVDRLAQFESRPFRPRELTAAAVQRVGRTAPPGRVSTDRCIRYGVWKVRKGWWGWWVVVGIGTGMVPYINDATNG